MSFSMKEIRASRTPEKKKIDQMDLWVYFFVRPVSFYFTYLLLKLKLSANGATLVATVVGVVGAVLICSTNHWVALSGFVILNLWIVLDCVDGNIARVMKKSSKFGEFLDGVSGYIFTSFLYIAIGVHVYLNYSIENAWLFIVIGAVTSLATIFPRLVEHKAQNMFDSYKSQITDKTEYSIVHIIGLNVAGMAGFSNPLMLVAFFVGWLNWYLLFYFIIHCGIACLTVLKTIVKVKKVS